MDFVEYPVLPAPTTPLVGRETELERLSALLERNEVRLVTMTGMGGVGKTRLVLALAQKLEGHFLNGVVFVPLSSVRDAALMPAALARALHLETVMGTPLETVRVALHDREMLVVFDNTEQILNTASFVTELLNFTAQIKVICTSRSPLRIRGEHEFPVTGLALNAAIQLFEARAQAIQPEFLLSGEKLEAVSEIAHRVGGLPLALELAAARVRVLSPQGILERLERPLAFLSSGAVACGQHSTGVLICSKSTSGFCWHNLAYLSADSISRRWKPLRVMTWIHSRV
jgi:predicted ATPase